ncbi:hypothetical protein HK099_004555 [Clydaea vesicula]|uniref:Nucleolar 27S pre-rRNA processing Urb2/Npa2 C-terminal domain-containing protein n=1 Tax=Clydaea vesicula TaxID=447962 RepID=A0AAD5XVJ3_9FUNG|nr:hypothetical protein HK099_004555 [Clydaea vesicula]
MPPEFLFYLQLQNLLLLTYKSDDDNFKYIAILGDLLGLLLENEIYKGTNDETSKLVVGSLMQTFAELKPFAELSFETNDFNKISAILKCWEKLLLLDFDIINNNLNHIVSLILMNIEVKPACNEQRFNSFFFNMFTMYRKSRMLDILVKEILAVWNTLSNRTSSKYCSLFQLGAGFSEYASAISFSLSSQVIPIYEILINEIIGYVPLFSKLQNSTTLKKKKKVLCNNDTEIEFRNPTFIIQLFLSTAKSHQNLSTLQITKLHIQFERLYAEYILPIVTYCANTPFFESTVTKALSPALQLHLILAEVDVVYWETKNTKEFLDFVVALDGSLSMVFSLKLRVLLSHVEHCFCINNLSSSSSDLKDIMENVAALLFPNETEVATPGQKRSTVQFYNEFPFSPESWEIIVQYIPILCHFLSQNEQKRVLVTILKCFCEANSEMWTSLKFPCFQLLQSAAFFEIQSLRDLFEDVFSSLVSKNLVKFFHFFKSLDGTYLEISQNIILLIQCKEKNNTSLEKIFQLLKEEKPPLVKLKSSQIEILDILASLVSTFHLFPLASYFSSKEIYRLSRCLFLLEVVVYYFANISEAVCSPVKHIKKYSIIIKLVSFLRKVNCTLSGLSGDNLILLSDPVIPQWFLKTLDTYQLNRNTKEIHRNSLKISTIQTINVAIRVILKKLSLSKTVTSSDLLYKCLKSTVNFIIKDLESSEKTVYTSKIDEIAYKTEISLTAFTPFVELHDKWIDKKKIKKVAVKLSTIIQTVALQSLKEFSNTTFKVDTNEVKKFQYYFNLMEELLLFYKANLEIDFDSFESTLTLFATSLKRIPHYCSLLENNHKVNNYFSILMSNILSTFCKFSVFAKPLSSEIILDLVKLFWMLIEVDQKNEFREVVLENVFEGITILIQYATLDQYLKIITFFDQVYETSKISEQHESIYFAILKFASAIINTNTVNVEKKICKKPVSSVLTKISQIVNFTGSLDVVNGVIDLFTKLFINDGFKINSEEISLILQSILIFAAPSFYQLRIKSGLQQPNREQCEQIFSSITRLLVIIIKQGKDGLLKVIPSFVSVAKSLMHCFRSPSGAYTVASTKQKLENQKHLIVPNGIPKTEEKNLMQDPFAILSCQAPLSPACADSLARVFDSLLYKHHSVKKSQKGEFSDDAGLAMMETSIKPFTKHVLYLVAEYIAIQISDRAILSYSNIFESNIHTIIVEGIYSLLDLLGQNETNYLLSALSQGNGKGGISGTLGTIGSNLQESLGSIGVGKDAARSLFKQLVSDYNTFHKFGGDN